MIRCAADEPCDRPILTMGLCDCHYRMLRIYGRTKRITRKWGQGSFSNDGYLMVTQNGKQRGEHIVVAEKALGKPLPKGAVVHHMNGNKVDNHTPFNLIICPNQKYHMLLHRRAAQLKREELLKKED